MRFRQASMLQALRNAAAFLDQHEPRCELANTETRHVLDDVIKQLTEQAVAQDVGIRGSLGETAKQRAARFSLRAYHMRPVAETAKLHLSEVAELAALRMPDSSARIEDYLAAAAAMTDAARVHEQLLIANGLPATFIAGLESATRRLRETLAVRDEHRRKRAGATAVLVANERRGRVILKVLDAVVLERLAEDEQLTAEWLTARRVSQPRTSRSAEPAARIVPAVPMAA